MFFRLWKCVYFFICFFFSAEGAPPSTATVTLVKQGLCPGALDKHKGRVEESAASRTTPDSDSSERSAQVPEWGRP